MYWGDNYESDDESNDSDIAVNIIKQMHDDRIIDFSDASESDDGIQLIDYDLEFNKLIAKLRMLPQFAGMDFIRAKRTVYITDVNFGRLGEVSTVWEDVYVGDTRVGSLARLDKVAARISQMLPEKWYRGMMDRGFNPEYSAENTIDLISSMNDMYRARFPNLHRAHKLCFSSEHFWVLSKVITIDDLIGDTEMFVMMTRVDNYFARKKYVSELLPQPIAEAINEVL